MSFETGAPPPPPPDHIPPVEVVHVQDTPNLQHLAAARPARGYDATTAILPGPPPGTSTYRLRATETTETAGTD
jgi:hypothetical protein